MCAKLGELLEKADLSTVSERMLLNSLVSHFGEEVRTVHKQLVKVECPCRPHCAAYWVDLLSAIHRAVRNGICVGRQDQVEQFLFNLGGHSAAPSSAAGEPAAPPAPQTLKRKAAGGDSEDNASAVKRQCADHNNVNALGEAYVDLGGLRRARSCRAGPLCQPTLLLRLSASSAKILPRSVQVLGL